jgi:hypothetical protein
VLGLEARDVVARIDVASDLHVELPPGVDLEAPHVEGPLAEQIRWIERAG